jgi:hypothetical protein
MTPSTETAGNVKKLAQLQRAMAELLDEILRRGFFGSASLEVGVQDGTIQSIRRTVEKVER